MVLIDTIHNVREAHLPQKMRSDVGPAARMAIEDDLGIFRYIIQLLSPRHNLRRRNIQRTPHVPHFEFERLANINNNPIHKFLFVINAYRLILM